MNCKIIQGDCLLTLPELSPNSIDCCVTSPPYWGLRDYGNADQLGLEKTPAEYVAKMVAVFGGVRAALKDSGTLWLNLGDSYKEGKQLAGIPWRVAFALQDDGWILRSDIIWHKPNPMPEPVTDRVSKAHEYIFMFSKSKDYYFDAASIKEPWKENAHDIKRATEKHPGYAGKHDAGYNGAVRGQPVGNPSEGRNKRTVWTVPTAPYKGAHFATFPPDLIEPCIKAGCPAGGTVLDPFGGAGTTGLVSDRLGRNSVLLELNPEYIKLAEERIKGDAPLFNV